MRNKSYFIYILLILLVTIGLSACTETKTLTAQTLEQYVGSNDNQDVLKAKVLTITSDGVTEEDYYGSERSVRLILFEGEIRSQGLHGELIQGRQVIDSVEGYRAKPVKSGDIIFVYPSADEEGGIVGDFVEYARMQYVLLFTLFFAAMLILFSGWKGVRSLIALAITCGAVFLIFIPMVLAQQNTILAALITSVIITAVTLTVVYGFKIKTLSSAIGCLLGVAVAGLIAFLMQSMMKMTGLTDNTATMLSLYNDVDMNGLLFAAIIIGALGATMDVSISIASALEEIIAHRSSHISGLEIIQSGMKIGGDIMGTMVNTLILAYVGSSMPILLLLTLNTTQFEYTLSWEIFSAEFLRALAGSIGLIFVVPATAAVTALLHIRQNNPSLVQQTDENPHNEVPTNDETTSPFYPDSTQ